MSILDRIQKAIQLKVYQYEVTIGLYMLEPLEKAIFNSIVGLFMIFFVYTCWYVVPQYSADLVAKSVYYLGL